MNRNNVKIMNNESSNREQELIKKSQQHETWKDLFKNACIGGIGGFVTIAVLFELTKVTNDLLLMASFGGSCGLAFSVWNAPVAQPRNIVGGHFISTCIGLLLYQLLGYSFLTMAAAVGLAIMCMMLSKTMHPPAAGDPIIIFMSGATWKFLLFPVGVGSIIIVLFAYIINNLQKDRKYPEYWI